MKVNTLHVLFNAGKHLITLCVEIDLCTFQGAWFLCDADLSLWDNGFTLRVANVSWDERQAGPLLLLRAREIQRQ